MILAQHHQLQTCDQAIQELSGHMRMLTAENQAQSEHLAELDTLMASLYAEAGLDRPGADRLKNQVIDPRYQVTSAEDSQIQKKAASFKISLDLPQSELDWEQYVAETKVYIQQHSLDLTQDPICQILPPDRAAAIIRQFEANYTPEPWDQWDYGVVGLTVLVGTLLDYFVAAVPPGSVFQGVTYPGSPLTQWFRDQSDHIVSGDGNALHQLLHRLSQAAEHYAKVSYDISNNSQIKAGFQVSGLSPKLHRLINPGHDPILGFIYGTLDLLNGQCTLIDKAGHWRVITAEQRQGSVNSVSNPFEALVLVAVHLFSDVFSKQGLPVPFAAALQSLTIPTGVSVGSSGGNLNLGDLTRYMYAQGYDLRHFMTLSVVPMVAEVLIRTYYGLRTVDRSSTAAPSIAQRLKLSQLLLMTHTLLGTSNLLKVALAGWNPLALNYAQFLMLAQNLVALLKLNSDRQAAIEQALAQGWQTLLTE
ncbi:MAG: hypothetical protein ACO4CG_04780 [Prochlorothrix sp.]